MKAKKWLKKMEISYDSMFKRRWNDALGEAFSRIEKNEAFVIHWDDEREAILAAPSDHDTWYFHTHFGKMKYHEGSNFELISWLKVQRDEALENNADVPQRFLPVCELIGAFPNLSSYAVGKLHLHLQKSITNRPQGQKTTKK